MAEQPALHDDGQQADQTRQEEQARAATHLRTVHDVANLFFVQELVRAKSDVERWQREYVEEADRSGNGALALWLYETCLEGIIRATLSPRQAGWLGSLITRAKQRRARVDDTVLYQGQVIGTWEYSSPDSWDPYARLIFRLDPAFMRDYVQMDTAVLERVKQEIESHD